MLSNLVRLQTCFKSNELSNPYSICIYLVTEFTKIRSIPQQSLPAVTPSSYWMRIISRCWCCVNKESIYLSSIPLFLFLYSHLVFNLVSYLPLSHDFTIYKTPLPTEDLVPHISATMPDDFEEKRLIFLFYSEILSNGKKDYDVDVVILINH
ncbi:hypothetical protein Avbf_11899 [Armadillidium vulgare]|nr:hypothetical protein Avbf_11899 [Armadillidium vulgare]